MRGRLLVAAAGAALLGAGGIAIAAQNPAAVQRDWTKMVAKTAEGGFRVGNPDAPVKLVEYGSMTCSHCAHFAEEGVPDLLRDHVRTGRVSFEFRNFVLNPYDLTASLLSRCAGPANFFGVTDAMFAGQTQWLSRYSSLSEATQKEIAGAPEAERPWRVAALGGLDAIAARGGVTEARAKACLADKAGITQLVEMRRAAQEAHQVTGTPTFLINGVKASAHDWTTLEPLLAAPEG
jgi:protein-disulfide isomerase